MRQELFFYFLDVSQHLQGVCGPSTQAPPGLPTQFTSSLCPGTQDPAREQWPILWAPKWVDYFSKYGFGYQLLDGSSGVLFRDGTHMALRPLGG